MKTKAEPSLWKQTLYVLAMMACVAAFIWLRPAHAGDLNASANLQWTPPACGTDGSTPTCYPLTGTEALTGFELFSSLAPITAATGTPVSIPASARTFVYTARVPNGSTMYFRLRAKNSWGVSALSPEASKLISVSLPPDAPPTLTVTVTVVVDTGTGQVSTSVEKR